MTAEGIVIGLLALVVGIAFCFAGVKWFLLLLPIWGFVTGFVFGSNGIYYLLNESFFATALAIVTGIVVGVIFAVLSYLFYYAAVVLLGGSLGYLIGIGVMSWLGIGGLLAWGVGIALAVLFAAAFLVTAMPIWLAIWGTAIGGAMAIAAGIALALGRVAVSTLDGGTIGSVLKDTQYPWLWIGLAIVLAIAGGLAQMRTLGSAARQISKDQYLNPGMS